MDVKPILFNTEMVRAILAGRKTQTRRIIKPQPTNPRWNNVGWLGWDDGHGYRMKPPCMAGDILWVRETFLRCFMTKFLYKADDSEGGIEREFIQKGWVWKPSIHMPKEAARIFLKVRDVRVERLRDGFFKEGTAILEVQKEGVDIGETCRTCLENYGCPCCIDADGDIDECRDPECGELDNPRDVFARLWDSTIKPADRYKYGWAANPWVWVIEFEQIEKPEVWRRKRERKGEET